MSASLISAEMIQKRETKSLDLQTVDPEASRHASLPVGIIVSYGGKAGVAKIHLGAKSLCLSVSEPLQCPEKPALPSPMYLSFCSIGH